MARHKEAPFYVRSDNGRALLDFVTAEGRVRKALGFDYPGDDRATPAERAAAHAAAEKRFAELTAGRVIDRDPLVATTMTLSQLYAGYTLQFEPAERDDENARRAKNAELIVRRAYGRNILDWASDEANRPDGSKRWARDRRTPLQRLCSDGAPEEYLAFRLTRVVRVTMRKEKSNLVSFFAWAKAAGYLSRVPAVELPAGKGKVAVKSGRGVDIRLTAQEARRIVAILPEWSSKPTRKEEADVKRFLVRPFFEFMWLTGLRPVTISRLIVGRNWAREWEHLDLTDEDDKARYGRRLPLSRASVALLERYAPADGHIFGHHDFRHHVAAAAAKVLDERRAKLFGSYHLRHFVGTFLASRTTNTAAGMFLMGHTEESTFSGYVHAREEEARELVRSTETELAKVAREAERWAAKERRR